MFLDDWSMVLVVDDRVDVWNSGTQRHQLLQVMPFVYTGFSNLEHIELEEASALSPQSASTSDVDVPSETKVAGVGDSTEAGVVSSNADVQLMRCLEIITDVHREFYDLKEQQRPATTGAILSQIKRKILEGCILVFSGVIPKSTQRSTSETHPIWQQAQDLGAEVCHELSTRTTHLITISATTTKAQSAISGGRIRVVHVDWLFNCIWNVKRIPEDYYLLAPVAAGSTDIPIGILGSVADPSDESESILGKRSRPSDSEDDDWLNEIEAELDL